jgi:hypothetical protein
MQSRNEPEQETSLDNAQPHLSALPLKSAEGPADLGTRRDYRHPQPLDALLDLQEGFLDQVQGVGERLGLRDLPLCQHPGRGRDLVNPKGDRLELLVGLVPERHSPGAYHRLNS